MLFSQNGTNPPRRAGLAASVAAHAALLVVVVAITLHIGRVRAVYRDSRCCTAALYWTGMTSASDASPAAPRGKRSNLPPVAPPKSSRIENPEHLRQPRSSKTQAPAAQKRLDLAGTPSPQQQQTLGTGLGDQDAEPAFPTFFPRPAVANRSLLPTVEQKIIVNVTISAQGDVTDEKLVQGFGNPLDQTVLDTVKSWRFHPATLNGAAVASTEQLVFPFSRTFGLDDGSASDG
ncbi:MAG TPA: TonB family protein [Acidobacteriaceae bacterium]|jgi:TonB family protein|nr:TonB family protein [Acidobacteriaceae bacterium]